MKILFILLAQYDGLAVVPLEFVCRDYFRHLTPETMVMKITKGDIKIPLVRMEMSQKCAKGIAITDLATYLGIRINSGRVDHEKFHDEPFGNENVDDSSALAGEAPDDFGETSRRPRTRRRRQ